MRSLHTLAGLLAVLLLLAGLPLAAADHEHTMRYADFHPVLPEGTEGGDGPATLRVLVREEHRDGQPMSGVAVSALYEEGSRRSLTLETDEDGVATFHLEAREYVTVSASNGTNWTTEVHPQVLTPRAGESKDTALPLFRSRLDFPDLWANFTAPGVLDPQLPALFGEGGRTWLPVEVPLSASGEAREGYLDRLVIFHSNLEWNNTPPAMADLGVGVGSRDNEGPERTADRPGMPLGLAPGQSPTFGEQESGFDVGPRRPGDHRLLAFQDTDRLYAGPVAYNQFAAPDGLPVRVNVTLFFALVLPEPCPSPEQQCGPGPGVALTLVAVLAAPAIALWRRKAGEA